MRVLLAAGGTGGHLFAAMALASQLQARGHSCVIAHDKRVRHYFKPDDAPDDAIEHFEVASATPPQGSYFGFGKALLVSAAGTSSSLWRVMAKRSDIVIGFGGYPSLPPLAAAVLLRRPIVVYEQNARAGRANMLMARFAARIVVAFDGTIVRKGRRHITVANPVRNNVIDARSDYAVVPNNGQFSLLIVGGSQGAAIFARTLPDALALMPEQERARLRVTLQCPQAQLEETTRKLADLNLASVELASFFEDLPERISQSSLVVSRSGASSVSELAVLGRPALFVPLASSLDGDQAANAAAALKAGGAWVVDESTLNAETLANVISDAMQQPQELLAMAKAMESLGDVRASSKLADQLEDVLR